MTIEELFLIIKERQANPDKRSYVASLFTEGRDRIIQKVGEEAVEVVIAAKNNDSQELRSEVADLWFHSLVLLAAAELTPEDVLHVLADRHKKKSVRSSGRGKPGLQK
jgi:phosphoribosyl-ATP pyrophosphohydrolase/phosphoribosyl-AMP cyclohydrolase